MKRSLFILAPLLLLIGILGASWGRGHSVENFFGHPADTKGEIMGDTSHFERATFAAGCFWGVEETFRKLKGVKSTRVGYTGGHSAKPTYNEVCTGTTGHAEAVQIQYDPREVSYGQLLSEFWQNHNPTTKDRQGPDFGAQYRSAIFYHTPEQEAAARQSRVELEKSRKWKNPVVTEITAAGTFWEAEEYHQQYLNKRGKRFCHF